MLPIFFSFRVEDFFVVVPLVSFVSLVSAGSGDSMIGDAPSRSYAFGVVNFTSTGT